MARACRKENILSIVVVSAAQTTNEPDATMNHLSVAPTSKVKTPYRDDQSYANSSC